MLETASDANVFQTKGWSEHKRAAGWTAERYAASDPDGGVIGMVQLLWQRVGPIRLGWAPGGPVLGFRRAVRGPTLIAELAAILRRDGPSYVRLASHHPATPPLCDAWDRLLSRPARPLTTGSSYIVDLSGGMDAIVERMTAAHRKSARRALAGAIAWQEGRDDAAPALAELYTEMSRLKTADLRPLETERIRSILGALGARAAILLGVTTAGPMAACLYVTVGRRAYALLPATGPRGRAAHAGFALHLELFRRLSERGVCELDLAGADPARPRNDVDRFKEGFGARLVEYLGERHIASPPWLQHVVSPLTSLRGGRF